MRKRGQVSPVELLVVITIVGIFIVLLASAINSIDGCNSTNGEKQIYQPKIVAVSGDTERFEVKSYGSFNGGYGDHKREMFIITDRVTKKQFFTVTGAGTTELWVETQQQGKTTVIKTVEE